MNTTTPKIYQEILARLAAVRRKQNIARIVLGVLFTSLLFVAGAILALTVESIFYLDVIPRTVLFWAIVLSGTGMLVWMVGRPALRLFHLLPDEPDTVTAAHVGAKFPAINDHLVNVLQLFDEGKAGRLYSADLIDASFEDVRKEITPLDFTAVVDTSRTSRLGKMVVATTLGAVVLFVIAPTAFFGSMQRLFNYSQSFAAPLAFTLVVEPGDREVVKGESVVVTVRVVGQPQREIVLSTTPAGQVAREEKRLTPTEEGTFTHELEALKATLRYHAYSGSIRSDEYTLTVLDRPVVKMLRVELGYPAYTRLGTRQLDDNVGDVAALKGTRVSFSVESSKELREAALVFSDGTERALAVRGTRASGDLPLTKERTYHIRLTDEEALGNAEPIEYSMRVIPDAYPTVDILLPGTNLDVAGNKSLNMLFRIADDYGFTSMRLAHRLVQSRYEAPAQEYTFVPVPLPAGVRAEAQVAYLWQIGDLRLVPEDVVAYYVEVFDNDNISGPKSAKSATFFLRLPSLDEVFADVDKGHDVSLDAMKEALREAQEAKKDLDDLQQQMKKNQQKLDWQEQQKAEEVLKKYQEIQKKIEEVNRTIDQMVNEMEKNEVLSPETMEKYQELQRLLEEMNSPEFAEAMKRLQQSLQQMSPEQMKQALQQFNFSEENFRKGIERTMNMLKRIQIEQKMEEVLKRTEEMMNKQEELRARTEQTNPQDGQKLNDLAQQQEDLKKNLEALQRELADLQKKMEDFPTEMPLDEMQEAMDQLGQCDFPGQMDNISQQLRQQQTGQAAQNQQRASQMMSDFMEQLQKMQEAMRQNQQRQIVNEMRKALQDLVELSKRQEGLKNESQSLEPNSQRFRENAQEQMGVMRDLANLTQRLGTLSQKTFGITPEMGKSIGDAIREMNNAMRSLDQRNGNAASQQQGSAMASLNQAAQQVQSSLDAMMQGQGMGMGMAGLMQRLQQMAGQQQGINEQTGGLTPQQAAELGRLAAEQGMVRKSLEQLAREAQNTGQMSRMLGDLNRIAQEMREVQTDLAQGNVNPETLRKQDRILSRLLDAQRSARERDFEKRRRAEAGRDGTRTSPGPIDLATQEGRNRLRQDLMKAREEGYARDYQDLIQKYFEALEKAEPQQ
jgi:hypothetical protein